MKLRAQFFEVYHNFVKYEYLRFKGQSAAGQIEDFDEQLIIDRMTKANQMESEAVRMHRHQSFSTLSSFLELFKHADSLKMVPSVQELQRILVQLLSSSEVKTQRVALECLMKSGYHKGLLMKY